jgi:DNA repair exonuclease SbcCD nuclease subunit
MKVAIITDQHFGARKGSKIFHDYFKKFYDEIFFPTLEKENISILIDMGDTFDNRKVIDFWSLDWAQKNYYDKLKELNIEILTVIGNHTAYYKNSNTINSIDLLLRGYDNIRVISETEEIAVGNTNILFIPWINSENESSTLKIIEKSKAKVVMGHLELTGFEMYRGMLQDHGMDSTPFKKFDRVFSGHYHTRSSNGRIFYLGNPYEMFWNDLGDSRGFHLYDTETYELTTINNPFRIFKKIYYSDTDHQMFDYRDCKDKFIKLVVEKKTNQKKFEIFFDKLSKCGCHEIKVIENFKISEAEDVDFEKIEDTISILNRYVEETELPINKIKVKTQLEQIYKEACELE